MRQVPNNLALCIHIQEILHGFYASLKPLVMQRHDSRHEQINMECLFTDILSLAVCNKLGKLLTAQLF